VTNASTTQDATGVRVSDIRHTPSV
jgi:hypothetical protein